MTNSYISGNWIWAGEMAQWLKGRLTSKKTEAWVLKDSLVLYGPIRIMHQMVVHKKGFLLWEL